jgi:X-X-X-Leu-X-X-Gly heptad repeat protein
VAWVTSPASHPPDLAGILTTCPNSLLSLKSNAQLMGVVYNQHGQMAGGLGQVAGGLGQVAGGLGKMACGLVQVVGGLGHVACQPPA